MAHGARRDTGVFGSRRVGKLRDNSAMKLTPELLAQASSFINAIKERQLDLRGSTPLFIHSFVELTL